MSAAVRFVPDVLFLFLFVPLPQDRFRPLMFRDCGQAGSGGWRSHGGRSYVPTTTAPEGCGGGLESGSPSQRVAVISQSMELSQCNMRARVVACPAPTCTGMPTLLSRRFGGIPSF